MRLVSRKEKCTGTAQECQTSSDISTLGICLAVIIPVVVVGIVVGFFSWKAYRRNKKESLEDNDPDFNGDNIVLPDFPNDFQPPPNQQRRMHPYGNSMQKPGLSHSNSFAKSMDAFSIPFADSMSDINKFSRTLGNDFQDFNYPIKKINNSPTRSKMGTTSMMSARSSFSENSKPLTGYANSFNSSNDHKRGSNLNESTTGSVNNKVEYTKEVSASSPDLDIDEKIEDEDPSQWQSTKIEDVSYDNEQQIDYNNKKSPNVDGASVENDNKNNSNGELLPNTEEEEEKLQRLKSVYNVYFSRGDSVKKPSNMPMIDNNDLPALPKLENLKTAEHDQGLVPQVIPDIEPAEDKPALQLKQNIASSSNDVATDGDDLPVNEDIYPHQQFLNHDNNAIPPPQAGIDYQQGYPQNTNYQQEYPQDTNYPQEQYYPQDQYYQQGQYYSQDQYYPQDQYAYPPQHFGLPHSPSVDSSLSYRNHHPLPDGKQSTPIPLPHQLAKRTSTLETFTTFRNNTQSRNPLKIAARPDDRFHPIEHAAWADVQRPYQQRSVSSEKKWKGELETQPSPSQLRHSVVMLNPNTIGGRKIHQYKGTAKEQVRMIQQNQMNGSQEPLYGFVDGFERPHGAENLIPRSNSEIDLRRELDNANV